MEEILCSIEIVKEEKAYRAKIQVGLGRYVEYENTDFESLIHQVYEDIQEEIENTL